MAVDEQPAAMAYLGLLLVVRGVLGVVRQELRGQSSRRADNNKREPGPACP
jgi:hypothetical protein